MSSISIRWERRAVREVRSLPREHRQRVVAAVDELARNPLRGRALAAEWKGLRRLRVGRYRVIYSFDSALAVVSVVRVGHRREVYR